MRGIISLLMAALAASPALAQERLPPSVGARVYDPQGGEVGIVQSVTGDAAIVSTGSTRATLGLTSFRIRSGRLTIGLARAALEAAAQRVQARGDDEVRTLLTPGANIYDREGTVAAIVESIAGERVTVLAGTIRAVFPLSAFRRGPRGPQINRTAPEFQADLRARSLAPAQEQPVQDPPSQE